MTKWEYRRIRLKGGKIKDGDDQINELGERRMGADKCCFNKRH